MKRGTLGAVGFTILGITMSLGWQMSGATQTVEKDTPSCVGADCNELDPVQSGCNQDASVVDEITETINRSQDNWQARQITIRKMYSAACDAYWTYAFIPNGTFLFVRDQETTAGVQAVRGMTKAESADYVWARSGMSYSTVANQACVSIPILTFTVGHDLYNEYCTEFN